MGTIHVFASHARLPTGTDLYERFKFLTLIVKIDIATGNIVDCCIPMYCQMHNDFIKQIITGKSLNLEKEIIIQEIDERVHTLSKRALIMAIQGLYNHFLIVNKNQKQRK